MSRESLNNERIRNEINEASDYERIRKMYEEATDAMKQYNIWNTPIAPPDDTVNHPDHYNQNGYECIDIMLATQGIDAVKSFCLCNAFKYIYRHRNKNHIEDIKKAIWYLNKFVELEESNNEK